MTREPIRPDYTPHARAERLIATARFALASASLTAVYLEPSTPVNYEQVTYALLLIYTVYAAVTAIIAWRTTNVPSARWRLASHALDLVLFSVFVYLTEGPASPFFLYFVFALFCATVRFSWRGILATGAASIAIYGTFAFVAWYSDPDFERSRVLIRITYLGVLATFLVYLGIYQQRLRTELASLAAWPRELASQVDDVLRIALSYAASVMRSERALLVWEEPEEPWVYAAHCRRDAVRVDRLSPGTLETAGDFGNASVFVRAGEPAVLVYDPARSVVREERGDPIGQDIRTRYDITSAIMVSLSSETLAARFIVPWFGAATADALALAHIAGRLAFATLEQFFFIQQVRQTASAEERLRISRELHDGIVQSLAGVGLRLQSLRTRFSDSTDAADELARLQTVLEQDQRELRTLVRELRPHDPREGKVIVADELRRMRERFPLEWGLGVEMEIDVPVQVPPRIAHDVCRIVNESLSNAARHGGASRAVVSMMPAADSVEIRIADNGKGFEFQGRRTLQELENAGDGPRTLKERVRALGGTMLVDSSHAGATIEVRIPIAGARA